MDRRLELHDLLCRTLGSRNVYYQPPTKIKMAYPAIVYRRNNIKDRYANGNPYTRLKAYSLTLIEHDPDSELIDKIKDLDYCAFDRHYVAENLNHDVFTIYY